MIYSQSNFKRCHECKQLKAQWFMDDSESHLDKNGLQINTGIICVGCQAKQDRELARLEAQIEAKNKKELLKDFEDRYGKDTEDYV